MKSLQLNKKTILLAMAFAAVYFLWGSTYLAIKYAIETFPPFIMAGSRFLFAGGVLFLIAYTRPDFERPTRSQWKTAFIVGTLLLLGGNGGVVIAQHYVSSSLAALIVAAEPFFIVILSWLWLGNARPNMQVGLGLVIGFFGVALLITGHGYDNGGSKDIWVWFGAFVVLISTIFWAVGSIYGLRSPVPRSSLLSAAMQMLCGGSMLMLTSLIRGEWFTFDVSTISGRSWLAVGYLILCGSLAGYTAYSWLLKNSQPSRVATYAYVNPVVAVFLGWSIAGEQITAQMFLGAVIVIISVILVTRYSSSKPGELQDKKDIHRSKAPPSANGELCTTS